MLFIVNMHPPPEMLYIVNMHPPPEMLFIGNTHPPPEILFIVNMHPPPEMLFIVNTHPPPEMSECLAELSVVQLWIVRGQVTTGRLGPDHECVHGPFDVGPLRGGRVSYR